MVPLLGATGITLAATVVTTRSPLVSGMLLDAFPLGVGVGPALAVVWVGLLTLLVLAGSLLRALDRVADEGVLVVVLTAVSYFVLVRLTLLNSSTLQARLSPWQNAALDSAAATLVAASAIGLVAGLMWRRVLRSNVLGERRARLLREIGWSLALGAVVFSGIHWGVAAGVNRDFAGAAVPVLGAMAAGAFLLGVLALPFQDRSPHWEEPGREKPGLEEPDALRQVVLAYALLPLVPVVRYLVLNASELSTAALVTLVVGAALLSLAAVVGLPKLAVALVGGGLRPHAVAVVPAASVFIVLNMASLSNQRQWFGAGQDLVILALLGALALLLAVVARLPKGFALTAVSALLVLEIVSPQFVQGSDPEGAAGAPDAMQQESWAAVLLSAAESFTERPDIYLLMYESYADQETMGHYGFDNSRQVGLLEDLGFAVVQGTYSNGATTLTSISRLLAAQSSLAEDYRYYTSGGAAPLRALSEVGYEMVAVNPSGWLSEGQESEYDRMFPRQEATPATAFRALRTVLRGEFRFEDSFESVDYGEYLEAKRDTLARTSDSPVFLQTINQLPGHSQNSGRCRPDEQQEYAEDVERANEEMGRDLSELGSKLDDAIVIIAGDHGPYLTQNCTRIPPNWSSPVTRVDVQDRYGVFLAIKWPSSLEDRYDIQVLQDVLPAVFATLSDDPTVWDQRPVIAETLTGAAGPARAVDGSVVGGVDDGRALFGDASRAG